jgi:NAD(P)-dependent dehydrogenase (short-subunit alcohol dehydrogenase family)
VRPAHIAADVTQPGAAEALAAEAAARWGALDAVVECVGGSIRSGFEALSDADWIGNYTFNVLSAVRVVRADERPDGSDLALATPAGAIDVRTRLPGRHNVANAAGVVAIAGLPPFGLFATEVMIVTAAFPALPWLVPFLCVGILVAAGALVWRVQGLVLGQPSASFATSAAPLGPLWLHLALVLVAGVWLPEPAVTVIRAAAAIVSGGG